MLVTNKPGPDSAQIKRMFDALAPRYDLFNYLMGMGIAPIWRKRALRPLRAGMKVLDVGCGTGDLAIEAAKRLKGHGEVTAVDFSKRMLALAKIRSTKAGLEGGPVPRIRWILMRAEDLPIEEEVYDLAVSGFVLRNVYEHIDRILEGVWRSLKPGGRMSFLDFTEPSHAGIKSVWRFYMNTVAGFYGRVLFGRDYPEFYLTDSADRFLKPHDFEKSLAAAGFREIRTRRMFLGVIVLYQAVK